MNGGVSLKDTYVYPAVLTREQVGGFSVEFPDLPGCLTCGDTLEETLTMAREAMSLHLYGMEEDGDSIPEPSDPAKIQPELGADQLVTLVDTWMQPFRSEMQRKSVNKMVTLPKWLSDLGERERINFSGVLREALIQRLGASEHPRPPRSPHRKRETPRA